MLHKDSKWYQQWKDFRDNNVVFNRECPHLRTARWQGSGRHSLSAPGGRAPDRGGDWGPRGQSLRQSHPACEQRSAGLRRPEGKHPGCLGRQGLCRRGWVTILTRASVVVGQAGASAPPHPCPPQWCSCGFGPYTPRLTSQEPAQGPACSAQSGAPGFPCADREPCSSSPRDSQKPVFPLQ